MLYIYQGNNFSNSLYCRIVLNNKIKTLHNVFCLTLDLQDVGMWKHRISTSNTRLIY